MKLDYTLAKVIVWWTTNKIIWSVRNGSGSGKGNQSFCEHEHADCPGWGQVGPVYKSSINQWDTWGRIFEGKTRICKLTQIIKKKVAWPAHLKRYIIHFTLYCVVCYTYQVEGQEVRGKLVTTSLQFKGGEWVVGALLADCPPNTALQKWRCPPLPLHPKYTSISPSQASQGWKGSIVTSSATTYRELPLYVKGWPHIPKRFL